jgi:hypothetical protein
MQKPRQIIQFTEPQRAWLLEESRRLGVTLSELVRRIIDAHRMVQK